MRARALAAIATLAFATAGLGLAGAALAQPAATAHDIPQSLAVEQK